MNVHLAFFINFALMLTASFGALAYLWRPGPRTRLGRCGRVVGLIAYLALLAWALHLFLQQGGMA